MNINTWKKLNSLFSLHLFKHSPPFQLLFPTLKVLHQIKTIIFQRHSLYLSLFWNPSPDFPLSLIISPFLQVPALILSTNYFIVYHLFSPHTPTLYCASPGKLGPWFTHYGLIKTSPDHNTLNPTSWQAPFTKLPIIQLLVLLLKRSNQLLQFERLEASWRASLERN